MTDQQLFDKLRKIKRKDLETLVESTGTAAYDDDSDQDLHECVFESLKADDLDYGLVIWMADHSSTL